MYQQLPATAHLTYLKIENGDFTRIWVITKMNSRHQQKGIWFIKLTKLSVFPAVHFHIIIMFDSGRITSIPKLQNKKYQTSLLFKQCTRYTSVFNLLIPWHSHLWSRWQNICHCARNWHEALDVYGPLIPQFLILVCAATVSDIHWTMKFCLNRDERYKLEAYNTFDKYESTF